MWFFGWAVGIGNRGYPGCDAIFHARSKDLKHWEVYSGEGQWDSTMTRSSGCRSSPPTTSPTTIGTTATLRWSTRTAGSSWPYSATGSWKKVKFIPTICCCALWGQPSDDGIHWKKTAQPLLIEPPETQHPSSGKGWTGDYHRPSLMWDQGKWRLWFDYWHPTKGICMGYAENHGQFDSSVGFKVLRAGLDPVIVEWPNPEVFKVGNRYHSFADPIDPRRKYDHVKYPIRNRAICEGRLRRWAELEIVGFYSARGRRPCHTCPPSLGDGS